MAEQFSIPEEFELSFRRLLPYLAAPLQNNPEVLSSLLLYLKMGGDKLARAAIDALNVSRRLEDALLIRMLREEALSGALRAEENEDDDKSSDEGDDEGEDEGEDEGDDEDAEEEKDPDI